jgi:hypothetical protein
MTKPSRQRRRSSTPVAGISAKPLYWRAWNDFNIHNNEAARADADRTRTLMVNPAVFLLSGLIEWRLLRRETAETEFQEALKIDFGQCEAAFCLGGVRAELRKLPEAFDRSPFAARRSWPAPSRASSVSGSVRQNSATASENARVRRRRSAGGTVQWSAHAVPSDVGVNVDTFLKWDDCVLHFVHLLRTLHFALFTSC